MIFELGSSQIAPTNGQGTFKDYSLRVEMVHHSSIQDVAFYLFNFQLSIFLGASRVKEINVSKWRSPVVHTRVAYGGGQPRIRIGI